MDTELDNEQSASLVRNTLTSMKFTLLTYLHYNYDPLQTKFNSNMYNLYSGRVEVGVKIALTYGFRFIEKAAMSEIT